MTYAGVYLFSAIQFHGIMYNNELLFTFRSNITTAVAYWLPDATLPKDFIDSKQLTPKKQGALFKKIRNSDSIGFVLRVLHASKISRNMLRRML
jgi:hypothetical protein